MAAFNPNLSALDPELLKTPFEVETDWHVLTGAACTGKTTLLTLLSNQGYPVLAESARIYFDREFARGQTLQQIRADDRRLQYNIAALQMEYEAGLDPGTVTFLDRGLPDSLPFLRLSGADPNQLLGNCFHYRYRSVFLLERLPTRRDQALGPEDEAASAFLDEWLERDYTALGYRVVRVPVIPPQERLDFILQAVSR